MIARWILFAVLELLLSAVAVLLSPLLAMCVVTRDNHPFCSAKGPRQYLVGWLHLFSTHDDGVDAGWHGGHYDDRAPAGWPQKAREGSWLYRWLLRVWWINRNTAYGFAHYCFAFDRGEKSSRSVLAQRGAWDTSTTNWLIQTDTNAQGRQAFQVRAQLYFKGLRYLRVNMGWKLDWEPRAVQVVCSLNPFKVWKEVPSQ